VEGFALALARGIPEAEELFSAVLERDPSFSESIRKFRQQCAENYLEYGLFWEKADVQTSRRFYVKGILCGGDCPELAENLKVHAERDISLIRGYVDARSPEKAGPVLKGWLDDLEGVPEILAAIGNGNAAELFDLAGTRALLEQDLRSAAAWFEKAIALFPAKAEYHVHMTDVCFSLGDYRRGVAALQAAVRLDRSNARLWELIGDRMNEAGGLTDAVAAWEQCFLALPERVELLRKMGDAYRKLDRTEAAEEAYGHYRRLRDADPS
jgi:tetratricopeptide (TPR) repeat protein